MKLVISVVFAALLASVLVGVASADELTPAQISAKCQQDAANEEIPGDEVAMFVRQCLEDNGISSATTESAPEASDDDK
jgi:hypothetical protein